MLALLNVATALGTRILIGIGLWKASDVATSNNTTTNVTLPLAALAAVGFVVYKLLKVR